MDLSISIGNTRLASPVCVASGTFGYGSEYEHLTDFNSIGAIFTKAVTLEARPGNASPRIIETPSGLLNSIGLANVGVDNFLIQKMPFLSNLPCAIIPNVAGCTENEYIEVVEKLEQTRTIFGYEINVSCPNVKRGAMAFGTQPSIVESLTAQLRKITNKPLIIKLSPNVTDITDIARAAEQGGADAISCINTLIGMKINIAKKKTELSTGTGGLSGPAIRPVGVAMTYKVSRAVSIPIFGIGGIMNDRDALEYLLAGASAVQIGTANFVNPSTVKDVLQGITRYCQKEKISCIQDLHSFLL